MLYYEQGSDILDILCYETLLSYLLETVRELQQSKQNIHI
jgi:hypothetical protein